MSGDEGTRDEYENGQRLDKWLWHARFARTRPAAALLIAEGYVRVNAKRETTCSKRVRRGDVLTLSLGRSVVVVRLRAFASRRGPAPEARMLYETLEPSPGPGLVDEQAKHPPGGQSLAPGGQRG